MAGKNDRNLWDAFGVSKNSDLQSTVESNQRVCVNGVEERGVDKLQSLDVQGPFFPLKAAPSHSPVTMATVSCSSAFPDESLRNGGELVELPKRHFCNSPKAMENSINYSKDPVEEKQEICNGARSNSVVNDTVMESQERLPVNEVEANEKSLETAVIVKSSDQTQAPSVRPVRSIFDHINSNFRSSTVSSTVEHYDGITHKEGLIMNSCKNQRNVSPNVGCLSPRDKQQIADAYSSRDTDSNLFERMRLSTGIADVTAHGQSAANGIPGFPFSEKLRRLTALKTDNRNIMSSAVQPLQTGYDAVNNGGSFRHVTPLRLAAQTPTNTVSARFVSGQNNSLGTEVDKQANTSDLNTAGVRFQSVSSLSCVDPTPGYVAVRIQNGIPENTSGPLSTLSVSDGVGGVTSTVVMDNSVVRSNLTGLPPSSQLVRLNRVVLDPVGKLKEQASGNNLNNTYLVRPFMASNPRPVSGYVTTVTPAKTYRSDVVVTSPFPDIQPTHAFSQEHSSNSRFPIVSPVIGSVGALQSPVVNPIVAQTTSMVTVSRHHLSGEILNDLSCAERLQPSPELKERRFRPVSPAKCTIHSESRMLIDDSSNSGQISSYARPSISNLLSISSNNANSDQRGSIEEEFADQSYECALCESANSPGIEQYLRCESPVTVQTSPLVQQSNSDSTNNSGEITNVQTTTIMQSVDEHERNDTSTSAEELPKITEPDLTESEVVKDTDRVSKKKQGPAMVRRLKTRLPSPVRDERNDKGDLYRDPSELTREERALQRAMMQFSAMEMKERKQAVKTKHLIKRRLRKRSKMPAQTVENTNRAGSKPWLKRIKKHRLWFSQRKRITVKLPAQENNSPTRTVDVQQTQIVRRKRKAFKTLEVTDGQHKNERYSKEKGREDAIVQPTDVQQIKETSPIHRNADVKQISARKRSRETFSRKRPKKEDLAAESSSGKDVNEACSCKRSLSRDETTTEMRKKAIKRRQMETLPNTIERKVESPTPTKNDVKPDRSHRVKTYMLVTSYQGFRDFTPVVLQSRTRGKSKSSDEIEDTPRSSEFPLLVVESVHSKLVKERVIAETVEVQQMVENSLKARGKWHGDAVQAEGETNDDESLQEARKLNVNRNTGETILHKAARLGYHETVRHHIHQGVDPNAKDNAGWTPLHEACSRGHVDVVKVLTKYGSDVNTCSNDGIRPIHDAAEGGHVNVLRVLLSYGADPLLATYSGNTASGCAKETRTKSFLEGYLGDVGFSNSLSSASEGEGGWEFTGSCSLLDEAPEHTSGIFDGVPEGGSICDGEFEMCDRPHIPTYNLHVMINDEVTSGRRNYVLLSDLLKHLRISKAVLMKKCRRLDIREMPWSQFLAEISDSPLCVMPKFPPADSSRQEGIAELVPLNYSIRRLLNIRVECVNLT